MKPAPCAEAGIILSHLKLQSLKAHVPGGSWSQLPQEHSVSDSTCSATLTLAVRGCATGDKEPRLTMHPCH